VESEYGNGHDQRDQSVSEQLVGNFALCDIDDN
jgi:hypothetical protein